jgi:hypothetical protein
VQRLIQIEINRYVKLVLESSKDKITGSLFSNTMFRRNFVATAGLLFCSGCLSDISQNRQSDSEFIITNERDSKLEVSIRLKDGNRAFAVEGFVLDEGETNRFTAGFVSVEGKISIAAKILSPQEMTYEQEEIPVGVPEYDIRIQSDSIDVVWAES